MQKALADTVNNLNLNRFIFVGNKYDNTYYLTDRNNGYIISKSLEKTAKEEKEWALNNKDFIVISKDFKYKSQIIKRQVKAGDSLKYITEKVIVYWSSELSNMQIHTSKYKESFGYYQIVTSELDMPDTNVIDIYHNLSQIEDFFRVMKSDLETRPMYVRTNEHIHAHLIVCLLSLVIIRIIQNKIKNKLYK